jgi:ABC-2 type transport system ATP-binding protein
VLVRSPKLSQLERILKAQKATVAKSSGGLKVSGVKIDDIGKLAFESGIPIYELSPQAASLEEAFLELTAGSEEYVAKTEGTK